MSKCNERTSSHLIFPNPLALRTYFSTLDTAFILPFSLSLLFSLLLSLSLSLSPSLSLPLSLSFSLSDPNPNMYKRSVRTIMTLRSNALVPFQLRPELCTLKSISFCCYQSACWKEKGRERERERVRCEPKVMQNAIANLSCASNK